MATFGWCLENRHSECKREYTKFYTGPKGRVVFTDEVVYCQCSKRGCKCFVKRADRTKKTTRRRKT